MTLQLEQPTTVVRASATASPVLSRTGLVVLLCGAFLPLLDFFIVNVALPTMDSTLHGSPATLQLVVAGYGVAYALMLVVGGRLGDAIGRRRMFMIGIAGFTMSSLLCGVAPNIDALIAFRVMQGLFAAMGQPQVLATFHATLEGPRRARSIGLYAAIGGIAASAGQIVGGAIIGGNIDGLSWRPIFLVNVPVGIAVLAVTRRFVPATRSPNPAGVDLLGTTLLGVTMIALLAPLTEGRVLGWPWWTWASFATAPVTAYAAIRVERNLEAAGGAPLIAPTLMRIRAMRRGLILAVPFFAAFGGFLFVFALAMQDGLHLSAFQSGIAIAPMTLSFLAGTFAAPRLIARFGSRPIAIAMGVEAVALVVLALDVAARWPHLRPASMIPELVIAGFAQSIGLVSLFRVVLAEVPPRLAGIGSGVLSTVQQFALALGVATLGSLYLAGSNLDSGRGFAVVLAIQAGLLVLVSIGSLRLGATKTAESVVSIVHVDV